MSKGTLETKLGDLDFSVTDGKHVWIGTPSGAPIMLRKVEYHVGTHLFLQPDGRWTYDLKDYSHGISRYNLTEVSRSAKMAIREVIQQAWNTYISQHPEIVLGAARAELETNIEACHRKIDRLSQELEDAQTELGALENRMMNEFGGDEPF